MGADNPLHVIYRLVPIARTPARKCERFRVYPSSPSRSCDSMLRMPEISTPPVGNILYVLRLTAVAAIGGFLFGFDSGVINGTVDALRGAFHTDSAGTGFAVASVLLGCAAGALGVGPLADRAGRRAMMIVTAAVFVAASWGAGAAHDVLQFNIARFAGGVAVGSASVLGPMYIAEVAPAAIRGRLGTLNQLALVSGLFVSFLSNYLIARSAGSASSTFWLGYPAWRWMFWVEMLPALLYLVGALLIPESPRFLVAKRRKEEAARVFARTGGGDADALVREVERTLAGEVPSRLSDVFEPGTRRVRSIVWVGIGLSAFQQFVGINIIFYYGEVLWEAAGQSAGQALRTNVITGMTNIVATLIALVLIDRIGRRPLLLIGSAGMFVTLAILAFVFTTGSFDEMGRLNLTPVNALVGLIAANLYILAFGVSWGPAVWVMLGEMFANRYRAAALAVSASAQWLANFVVTISFLGLVGALGLAGAYSVYAAAALLSLAFVFRFVHETRGKRLEEMDNGPPRKH